MEKKMGKEVKEMKKVKMFRELKRLLKDKELYYIVAALRGPDVKPDWFSSMCLSYIFAWRLRYFLKTWIGPWRKRKCIDIAGCLIEILVWEQELLWEHKNYLWHVAEAFRYLKNVIEERYKEEVETLEKLAKTLFELAIAEEEGNEKAIIDAMDKIVEIASSLRCVSNVKKN